MSELYELGVVWRFRYPLLGGGSQPWHYALGYQGARLQAAQRGEDPPRPQAFAAKLERLAESPKLAHLLGVNDFFSALAGHARHRKGRGGRMARADGLQVWLSEQQVAKRYAESLSYIQSSRWDVRPDGFGEWQEGGRTLAFYLEYDTGTETLPRVADKVKSYVGDSDVFAPNLHGMILFWLHSSRREQGLRAELIRHPTTMPIATAAADYGDPAGPAGPVWLPLVHPLYGKPTRITLGQLPHAIGGTEPNGTPTVLANLRRARDDVTPRQW